MTLNLDFQGQILKMLYLRNRKADWRGTKGMWVDRMLHPLCDFQLSPHPWPWPWIFKVIYIWVDRILHPLCDFQMFPSPLTLTLDFQGQILKKSNLRNGMADWHGIKGMWVDRMLDPCCDFQCPPQPWPWPWIFKVKFWKICISGMGWPIDIGWKGCESIGCWTHVVTFNLPLTHDLDLGFSRSNFENAVSPEWEGRLTWNERDVSR